MISVFIFFLSAVLNDKGFKSRDQIWWHLIDLPFSGFARTRTQNLGLKGNF